MPTLPSLRGDETAERTPFGRGRGAARRPMGRIPSAAWGVAAGALAVRLTWLANRGVLVSPDSVIHAAAADAMLDGPSGWPYIVHEGLAPYVGSLAIVAALKVVIGPHFFLAWALLQVFVSSAAAIPLYLLTRAAAGARAALAAGLAYATLLDVVQWVAYPLSDSFLVAAGVTAAYATLGAVRAGTRRAWTWTAVAWAGTASLRPPALPLVAALAFWAVMQRPWPARPSPGGPPSKRWPARVAVAGLLACGVFGVAAIEGSGLGTFLADSFARGRVVDGDPGLDVGVRPRPYAEGSVLGFVASNPDAFAVVLFRRIGTFWTVALPRYSDAHVVVNLATLLPVVGLGLAAMPWSVRARESRPLLLLATLAVLALNYFHALFQIDYDFRYRAPALPFVALLFGAAVDAVWNRAAYWWAARGAAKVTP